MWARADDESKSRRLELAACRATLPFEGLVLCALRCHARARLLGRGLPVGDDPLVGGLGLLGELDHAPGRQFYGGKLGIDATHKLPEEDARPWPEEIVMSDDVRELVSRRWAEYGL